mmetsp:Transcript_12920/g.27431  ORF Transcript_12920/g.27431 Transcript_12920/m.27431 type:complete len:224 (-) Transcript_12920:73-744(-)|eukprot:CAMPEP_0171344100 /NCGR_PEP_ID=MMETSP0878-20121228/18647_1 /TAXON_ID=67004 /ORGANISM="Thalassiosira weissflogii, Strain CCMP1336" /LENGTH=223 /DNA_ID=CAMNT_0011847209 /DNA_START=86 /DNA_END=757 /DNA_ORIENTATION=+
MGDSWENIDWGQESIKTLNLDRPSLNSSSVSNIANDNADKPRRYAVRRGSWLGKAFNTEQEKDDNDDTSIRKPAGGFSRSMSLRSLVPLQDESVDVSRKKMSRRCSTGLDVDWPEAKDDHSRHVSQDGSKKDEWESRFSRRMSLASLESESKTSFPGHCTFEGDPETKVQGGQLRRSSFVRSSMAVLDAVANIANVFENDVSDSDDDLEVPFPSCPRRTLSHE